MSTKHILRFFLRFPSLDSLLGGIDSDIIYGRQIIRARVCAFVAAKQISQTDNEWSVAIARQTPSLCIALCDVDCHCANSKVTLLS